MYTKQAIRMIAIVTTLSVGLATSVMAQTTLRYAHVGSEAEIQYWYAEEFSKRVEERTEGRITVNVFPNSQLGGVQETIDGVRSGAIPIAHHEFASLATLMPEIAAFSAPFAYRDGEHAMASTDPQTSEIMQELAEQMAEQANVRIIGRLYRGARQMTANKAVYSPDDLAGERFRGVPMQLWTTMINGMGAVPTPVEVSELPTALMTGMVMGQENPLDMINANRLYEVQTHVMLTGHMQNMLPVFINENVWQSLSEEDRAILSEVAAEVGDETLERGLRAEIDLIEELTEKGMTFISEDDGLDMEQFRTSVSAQIEADFPSWAPIIERIQAIE